MKALAVCSTYGRIPYLGRLLSSFTNQTYDDKHLVIINDDKNVELCCSRKDVTILNCNQRLTLSDKRNIGISIGTYDIIFPFDDDDIYLPNRMVNHIQHYDSDVNAFKNTSAYIIYGDKFQDYDSSGLNNDISFRQSEWRRIGGYTTDNIYEDLDLNQRIEGMKVTTCHQCKDFVYQFGGVNYHLSNKPMQFSSFEEIAYKQLESLGLIGKKFWIEPDFEQYNNIMLLKNLFDKEKKELTIKHVGDAKIDISHLL